MHCASCGATLPDDATGPCPTCGAEPRLQGRFMLRAPIGAGAHGTTWEAVDTASGARVAVKELPLRLGAPDKVIALFRREAEVLRQLDHPAIPSLIDAFEAGQGRRRALWIAMDFVEGRTLAQEVEVHRYDEDEVLDLLEELCEVLRYLHSRQPPVVHRDLKPGNVIRRPDGRLAVVDFGSVRDAMRCADLGGSTVAGTFGYMAPEQFAGDAEPRSDLYAIGALGVHLLTRKAPHRLQRPGHPIAFADHAALRPGVAELLRDLVALDPADRPASAAAVADRIRAIRSGEVPVEQVMTTSTTPPSDGAPTAQRSRGSGAAGRTSQLVAAVGPDPSWMAPPRPPSLFADELRLTVHAARPVTAADEGAILDAIAETIGLDGEGRTTEGGYRWRSRVAGRSVRLAIDTIDDGARIRIIEDHTPATLGYLFGLGGGVIGGVGGGFGWIFFKEFGLAAGFVFLIGIALTMGLLSVGVSRTSRRVRDDRSALLATALLERLGGPTGPAPQLPARPEQPLYTGAAGIAAATAWTLFDYAGAPLGPWWVAIIVLAASLGGLSPGTKKRARRREAQGGSRPMESTGDAEAGLGAAAARAGVDVSGGAAEAGVDMRNGAAAAAGVDNPGGADEHGDAAKGPAGPSRAESRRRRSAE